MASKVLAGRYELFEKIGEGGMSVVYKAKDRLLNRFVAIKVLKPEFIKDRKFIESFRRESQSAASLSHSNIVNIFDVGQEGNIHYIVMELVTGNTLSEMIREEGPLPYPRVIELTKQIASALSEAHKNHLIHRDVKPHNVMLTADGVAKITDFGIAKAINSSTIADTLNGGIMGSVHYFSPEQARGGYVDEKSDIYSLGIVMYEMLTGRVPFDGDNPVNIALMHINGEMVPPSKLISGIPPALERIVLKATNKYQSNRFTSVDEMIQALDNLAFVSSVVGDSVLAGSEDVKPVLEADKDEDEEETKPVKKEKKSGKGKVVVGIIAALAVVAGIMIAVFGGSNDPIVVPELEGCTLTEAKYMAEEVGFEVEEGDYVSDRNIPEGSVVSQTPEANSTAMKGSIIRVNISKGPGNGQVPDLVGKTEEEAEELLIANGFELGDVSPGASDLEEGIIYEQYPIDGTTLQEGSTVDIKISDGSKAKVKVPYLVGKDIDEAKILLSDTELDLGEVTHEPNTTYEVNEIIWQEIDANEEVEKGTTVAVKVSTGPEESKPVDLYIDYAAAENDVFFMTVTISDEAGTRNIIANQQRNKTDNGENVTLEGEGQGTVVVVFDGKEVINKKVDFTKGTIS